MPYLVHVLFKPFNLSNVGAQNQSLFKQCNFSNVKNGKSGNISKSGNEVLKNLLIALSLTKSYLIKKLSILVDISNLSCTGVKSPFKRAVISRHGGS